MKTRTLDGGSDKVLVIGGAPGGAYLRDVLALAKELANKPGLHRVCVCHDPWCGLWFGRECDCTPILKPEPIRIEPDLDHVPF